VGPHFNMEHLISAMGRVVGSSFRMPFALLALTIAFSLVGIGCARSQPEGGSSPALVSFSKAALIGDETFESHSFREEIIFSCMKREGFDYSVRSFDEIETVVFDSEEIRREQGFGISTGGNVFEDEETELDVSSDGDLEQGEDEQLFECEEEAQREYEKETAGFIESLSSEDQEFLKSVAEFRHPLMIEAMDAWAECMGQNGYDYRSVAEMYDYANSNFTDVQDLDEEIELSLTDWRCSETEQVSGSIDKAYAELDNRLGASWGTQLR